jgi:hypothetical protein
VTPSTKYHASATPSSSDCGLCPPAVPWPVQMQSQHPGYHSSRQQDQLSPEQPCRHFKIQSCFCLGSAFEVAAFQTQKLGRLSSCGPHRLTTLSPFRHRRHHVFVYPLHIRLRPRRATTAPSLRATVPRSAPHGSNRGLGLLLSHRRVVSTRNYLSPASAIASVARCCP